jgi:phage major head subunit gpT-like protein
MKSEDVKTYEIGEHCFGPILKINETDYEDLNKEEVLELIDDMCRNDINSDSLLFKLLQETLSYIQYDLIEEDNSTCDQCGNWNFHEKYQQ